MKRSAGLDFYHRKRKVNKGVLREIVLWIGEIAFVMVIAVMLVTFIGFRITVVGSSMSPTLESGEEILVNRFVYKLFTPKQNDLIVFLPNGNEKSHYYVKRVIATPGDTIQVKAGLVYVNGKVFEEKVKVSAIENPLLAETEITVREDEYFVLGDNRNNSEDSRYASIGNINKNYIVGKAWYRIAPWKKFGFIK
ncbi:MAG: signal peptidase I [Lachnospiraceae bacterium]